jgi:tellurite resistance protein TerC
MQMFHYLHYGLSGILVFVGAKMTLVDIYKIPVGVSLSVVAAILVISVIASRLFPPRHDELAESLGETTGVEPQSV